MSSDTLVTPFPPPCDIWRQWSTPQECHVLCPSTKFFFFVNSLSIFSPLTPYTFCPLLMPQSWNLFVTGFVYFLSDSIGNFDAIVFHIRDMNHGNISLPVVRKSGQRYIMFMNESPTYDEGFPFKAFTNFFNWTMYQFDRCQNECGNNTKKVRSFVK